MNDYNKQKISIIISLHLFIHDEYLVRIQHEKLLNDSLTDTLNKNLRILETGGHKLVKHEIQIS